MVRINYSGYCFEFFCFFHMLLCMLLCFLMVSSPQPTVLFAKEIQKTWRSVTILVIFGQIILEILCSEKTFIICMLFRGPPFKGAVSSCIFAAGSPVFPPINKSQYLTSTYSSPQSKHFKKKCQPKYSNFEKRK